MATWTDPVIFITDTLSAGRLFMGQQAALRSSFASTEIAWGGNVIGVDVILKADAPIIVSLVLKSKWGL